MTDPIDEAGQRIALELMQVRLEREREKLRRATFEADMAEEQLRFFRKFAKNWRPE
jgi:hypothetical protein